MLILRYAIRDGEMPEPQFFMVTQLIGRHENPSQKYNLLFSLFMSLTMAFIMSGVLTTIYHGFESFIASWMLGFVIALPIAFPAVLVIAPRVRRLVQRLTAQ